MIVVSLIYFLFLEIEKFTKYKPKTELFLHVIYIVSVRNKLHLLYILLNQNTVHQNQGEVLWVVSLLPRVTT